MTEPKMMKAKGDGIQIQLAIWEGKGREILCIHGLTANSRFWDCLASALSPHYRVIAMDLRGRGLSDKPPTGYSIEHHCKDVLALIDDLGLETACPDGPFLGGIHLACLYSSVSSTGGPADSRGRWGKTFRNSDGQGLCRD